MRHLKTLLVFVTAAFAIIAGCDKHYDPVSPSFGNITLPDYYVACYINGKPYVATQASQAISHGTATAQLMNDTLQITASLTNDTISNTTAWTLNYAQRQSDSTTDRVFFLRVDTMPSPAQPLVYTIAVGSCQWSRPADSVATGYAPGINMATGNTTIPNMVTQFQYRLRYQ